MTTYKRNTFLLDSTMKTESVASPETLEAQLQDETVSRFEKVINKLP
jgi:hypothetical protein